MFVGAKGLTGEFLEGLGDAVVVGCRGDVAGVAGALFAEVDVEGVDEAFGGRFVVEVAESGDGGLDAGVAVGGLDDVEESGDGIRVVGSGECLDEFVSSDRSGLVVGEHFEEACYAAVFVPGTQGDSGGEVTVGLEPGEDWPAVADDFAFCGNDLPQGGEGSGIADFAEEFDDFGIVDEFQELGDRLVGFQLTESRCERRQGRLEPAALHSDLPRVGVLQQLQQGWYGLRIVDLGKGF